MLSHIDLHCDTLYRLTSRPDRFFSSPTEATSQIYYSGLCSSGTLLQCFAIFTDLCDTTRTSPSSDLREQYACFQQILSLAKGHLAQVKTSAQLTDCLAQNKIGVLLTLEESCLSETPISLLSDLYAIGVRMATLTWDYSTILGTSAANAFIPHSASRSPLISSLLQSPPSHTGLTPYGFDFIAEAERLGIIIDVSHLSDAGFRDVASHCKKPFLASHSNARSVCNVPRNLSDEMLRTLAERGGLVGLCLHEPFLISSPGTSEDVSGALAKHVNHILSVAGSDILALGTDFDGTPGNRVIPDIAHLFRLESILKKAGLTTRDIEKIFYKNALRFLKENLPL